MQRSLMIIIVMFLSGACEDQAVSRLITSDFEIALEETRDVSQSSFQDDFNSELEIDQPHLSQDFLQDSLLSDQQSSIDQSQFSIDFGNLSDMGSSAFRCNQLETLEHVYFEAGEHEMTLSQCVTPSLSVGLTSNTRWRIELRLSSVNQAQSEQTQLTIAGPSSAELSGQKFNIPLEERSADLYAEFEWTVEKTGEHLISLNTIHEEPWHLIQQTSPAQLWVRLTCLDECHLTSTRYPIVLIHGYAGVDEYFGLVEYFYRVPDYLRSQGYDVWVPSLSPIEWSEERARQLSNFLDEATRQTGAHRFNLIAHSQGGLDARVLISGFGEHERVASLTTIATPHRGIPIRITDFLSVQDFSPEYLTLFNQNYPDHPSVRYFSWSAQTCSLIEWSCLRDHDHEVVTPFLLPTYTLLRRFGNNDGLVPTSSMIYGEHLGEINADHFDQIGQIADQTDGPFAHRAFYLREATRLKRLGF